MKIAVVLGSIREGRLAPSVGNRILEEGKHYSDIEFELVDLKEHKLPVMEKRFAYYDGTEPEYENLKAISDQLHDADGFIFVTQEYNHTFTAATKNIFDYFEDEYKNKAAGIVSYGNDGGVRGAEQLRLVFPEVRIAGVRMNATFDLFDEFNDSGEFIPKEENIKHIHILIKEVKEWSDALKHLRKK